MFPVFGFRVIPIRREKNGRVSGKPKVPKRSLFSRKNCLLSGKNNSKRLRLVTCLSTSTCEKSGFTVKSKFSEGVTAILASIPTPAGKLVLFGRAFKSLSLRGKSFSVATETNGINEIFAPGFGGFSSQIMFPAKAKLAGRKLRGTGRQVDTSFLFSTFLPKFTRQEFCPSVTL